jgi:pimeloyl-ACP methyl ester carboxylesterase
VVTEADLQLGDGRTLHFYDTGADDAGARLAVFWHHGTPNTGDPPEPLFPAAEQRAIRWVSYDRPSYGGSSPQPGRDIASAAADVASVADALGIERFAVMGHSGGGPHALACGALLSGRVVCVVSVSGMAPFAAEGLDWFAGLAPSGERELRAAVQGRAALESRLAALFASEPDPEPESEPGSFTAADEAALEGSWSWMAGVAGKAIRGGMRGMVDDDLAYVNPWGFDPAQVSQPVLLMHGEQDRMVPSSHGSWLARRCPSAELRLFPDDGHISVLNSADVAMDWLADHALNG